MVSVWELLTLLWLSRKGRERELPWRVSGELLRSADSTLWKSLGSSH